MSWASGAGSQDLLLQSRGSDESEFGDFRSSSARSDDDDGPVKRSHQAALGLIEPFGVEESDLEGYPSSVWNRFLAFVLSRIRPKRRDVMFKQRVYTRKPLLSGCFVRRPRASRFVLYLIVGCLSILGLIHLFGNLLEVLKVSFPDDMDWILHSWGQPGEPTESWAHWPTDATADVHPVNCHSHNDYWRSVPLYAAIYAGCTGVEADVWLVDDELYVGHRKSALTTNRTLQNLYINPVVELLEKQNPPIKYYPDEDYPIRLLERLPLNGVFDVIPSQTFTLLIDFKTSGPALWWKLNEQLTALRQKGYLTHFNGTAIVERPITVVGTGNAPFDFLTANETYRDVFFDAPLEEMVDLSVRWPNPNFAQDPTRADHHSPPSPGPDDSLRPENVHSTPHPQLDPTLRTNNNSINKKKRADRGQGKSGTGDSTPDIYDPTNSYYASTSFTRSIGHIWGSRLTQNQLQLIRGQIRGAHARGLKVRYWNVPMWPIGLRNHVWHILMREGVDMLNVDDLRGGTRRDWRRRKGPGY